MAAAATHVSSADNPGTTATVGDPALCAPHYLVNGRRISVLERSSKGSQARFDFDVDPRLQTRTHARRQYERQYKRRYEGSWAEEGQLQPRGLDTPARAIIIILSGTLSHCIIPGEYTVQVPLGSHSSTLCGSYRFVFRFHLLVPSTIVS